MPGGGGGILIPEENKSIHKKYQYLKSDGKHAIRLQQLLTIKVFFLT
jgi:hypothetical protein